MNLQVHFSEDSFENQGTRRLKRTAVPTIFNNTCTKSIESRILNINEDKDVNIASYVPQDYGMSLEEDGDNNMAFCVPQQCEMGLNEGYKSNNNASYASEECQMATEDNNGKYNLN